jgi:hypothetical protein
MQDPNGSTIELCCYTPTALNAGLQSLHPVACSPGQCQAVCLIPSALPGYGFSPTTVLSRLVRVVGSPGVAPSGLARLDH